MAGDLVRRTLSLGLPKKKGIPKTGKEILKTLIATADLVEKSMLVDGQPAFACEDGSFTKLVFEALRKQGYAFENYTHFGDPYYGTAFDGKTFGFWDGMTKEEFLALPMPMAYFNKERFENIPDKKCIMGQDMYIKYEMDRSWDHYFGSHFEQDAEFVKQYPEYRENPLYLKLKLLYCKMKGMKDAEILSKEISTLLEPGRLTPADLHNYYYMWGSHIPVDFFKYNQRYFRIQRKMNKKPVDGEHFSALPDTVDVQLLMGKVYVNFWNISEGNKIIPPVPFAYTLFKEKDSPLALLPSPNH